MAAAIILKESSSDRGHLAHSFVITRRFDVAVASNVASPCARSGAAYLSGAVMGGTFGMLQGARAASKLKMVYGPFEPVVA